ncbi:MAG TPA: methyltransferase domain-containing protein [Pseudonocardia sp.]|jgi:SAM-dependent methyltransferase|nr:methyltransferase domain-containing protein [Pseudonocardia sp.]
MTTTQAAPDTAAVEQFLGTVATDVATTFHAATVALGDKLGLWAALAERPVTPDELAARTGCDARYLSDWLAAQYVSGYCVRDDDGRFRLTEAQAAVLADPAAPTYLAGAAVLAGVLFKDDPVVGEAFRTGSGIPWHAHHDDLFTGTERLFRPGYAANLVASWIPALDGVAQRLTAGTTVADVGCGHGASTILLAQAYPDSEFLGVDYHRPSIEAARERAAQAGVGDRVRFEAAGAADFPGERYGLVCVFDALHDMGDPVGAARHIRAALADDGTFLLVEPMAGERLEDNVSPVGRMFYSAAPFICRPHARSEHGPHELGNQVPDSTWRELLARAGFSRFRRATETPFNRVFEVRP